MVLLLVNRSLPPFFYIGPTTHWSSKKHLWRLRIASSTWSFLTTKIIFTIDAPWLIISIVIYRLWNTRKAVDNTSDDLCTSLIRVRIARSFFTVTFAYLDNFSTALSTCSGSCFLSNVRETDTSDEASTSTESLSLSRSWNTLERKPYAPSICVDSISISWIWRLHVIAVTYFGRNVL